MLHAGEPLLVRWPAERGDGPDLHDAGALCFDVSAELSTARPVQHALTRRRIPVAWVEQAPVAPGAATRAPVTHPVETAGLYGMSPEDAATYR